jgi:hypothetical protein
LASTTLQTSRRLDILEANLTALGATNPAAARILRATEPTPDIQWVETPTGALSATLGEWDLTGMVHRALASRRDPLAEAKRLSERVDVVNSPVVVVVGFGLGYHVADLARRMGRTGIVVAFEPDLGLLRAVFERIDHSAWIHESNLVLLSDADDEGAMAGALKNLEGAISMGVQVIEHPASQARLAQGVAPEGMGGGALTGGLAQRFVQRFTRIVKAARTSMATTLVQSEATLRNLTQNVDYGLSPGVGDLAGLGAGRAAIVVSAGPSLQRNIHLLSQPGVRDRFVIIATQTVLKPLLARGITPHFVTALDFHEISRRFYEGLKSDDVRGITLVIDPKVNPAVPVAFPGVIRSVASPFLDRLLGPDFQRPMGHLPPGATVAHLAYYLARHLGCDPVLLVGQDLGFTDGQYYAAGAAIHDVWAGELNPFNSLEMLEWQRIVRMRGTLRKERDVLGRPIYTDEQMSTYLLQFQRDFKADADRGLLTIDATEGGVAKAHTTASSLQAALRDFAGTGNEPFAIPEVPRADRPERSGTARRIIKRIQSVRRDVWRIGTLSRETGGLLDEMLSHHEDQTRVNRLIGQVEAIRDQVTSLQPAFSMIELLNQTGAFNRVKTDRRIRLGSNAGSKSPLVVQREQIERDRTNVRWIADAADALGEMLDDAVGVCEGKPKRTRDPARDPDQSPDAPSALRLGTVTRAPRVAAVIPVDLSTCGLGVARDLAQPVLDGHNLLQLTLARLARAKHIDRAILLATQPHQVRQLVGDPPNGLNVHVLAIEPDDLRFAPDALRGGRLFAAACWRGGLGGLTAFDEALWPGATTRALRDADLDAALVLGPEWALIDPALCDAMIERYREVPTAHRLTFSQAAPGLAPALVDLRMIAQIAERRPQVGSFASIGGVLGYVPTAPAADFVTRPMCLSVPPPVRDALRRCVLDTPAVARSLLADLARAGIDARLADAADIARGLEAGLDTRHDPCAPAHLVIDTADAADCTNASSGLVERVRRSALALGPWAALSTVTLAGTTSLHAGGAGNGPDLLDTPGWEELVHAAKAAGFGAVHLRTTLRAPASALQRIRSAAPDVVSVDLVAEDAATYASLAGEDSFAQVRGNLAALLQSRTPEGRSGLASCWVVPRITRRDAVYEHIENFFDYWTLMLGCAVIDPLPGPIPGERIAPLPLPALAARRQWLASGPRVA